MKPQQLSEAPPNGLQSTLSSFMISLSSYLAPYSLCFIPPCGLLCPNYLGVYLLLISMLWVTAKATFFQAFNLALISHLRAKADENYAYCVPARHINMQCFLVCKSNYNHSYLLCVLLCQPQLHSAMHASQRGSAGCPRWQS